ncbi:MAG: FecR domain-containing protein [Sphingobacterium sp.]|jgi:ferric-dicitrate binding protein FerR (iron transport regulator)|nr:FecR domain-containing protein [Sphingobacterium sp.]
MQDKFDSPPSIEELIVDISFVHFCLSSNAEDVVLWNTWLADNPQHQARIEEAKQLVLLLSDSPTDIEVSTERQKLLQSLDFAKGPNIRRSVPMYRWMAAAVILIFLGLFVQNKMRQTETVESNAIVGQSMVEQTVPAGKMMHLRLTDGTEVDLAAGSTLLYPSSFTDTLRKVELKGDARFAVAHHGGKPFVIQAGNIAVKVLGTTFNVQAFESDRYTRVVLFEGKVRVSNEFDNYTITPGQVLIFDKQENKFSLGSFEPEEEAARINGLLVFEHASYEEVGQRLAHKYGITYEPNSKIDMSFSGKIAHEPLDAVIEKLNFTTNYYFYIQSNTLKVKNK